MDDRLSKAVGSLLLEAVTQLVQMSVRVKGHQPSLTLMMVDKSKIPDEMMKHKESFLDVLTGYSNKAIDSDMDADLLESLPYPIIAVMPPELRYWGDFLRDALAKTNSVMYAVITEAHGVKSRIFEDAKREFFCVHPDNFQDYALIQLGVRGKSPITYAAPINLNVISRDGRYGRKVGDFNYVKWTDKSLPTNW